MKNSISLAILFFLAITSYSQESNALRKEIEAKVKSDNYNIVATGENGLIIFAESDDKVKTEAGRSTIWNLTNYNGNFHEIWNKEIPVLKGMDEVKYVFDKTHLFLLFKEVGKANSSYHAFRIDIKTGRFLDVNGSLPNVDVGPLKIIDGQLIFGGTIMPTKGQMSRAAMLTYCGCFIPAIFGSLNFKFYPLLYAVDFQSNNGKILDVTADYKGSLTDIQIDDKNQLINAIVLRQRKDKVFYTTLDLFDEKGKKQNSYEMKTKNNNILINGKVFAENSNDKVMIGAYSLDSKKKKAKKSKWQFTSTAEGLYFTKLEGEKQKYIKYYSFVDLGKIRSEDEEEEENRKKEKKSYDEHHRLLTHDIIEHNDEYILIAEAYYPEYHYETYVDANGNTQRRLVFDGWRYSHAYAIGFDKSGNLLWNHEFLIMDILTFNLTERVKVLKDKEDIVLVYAYGGAIKSKTLRGKSVVSGKKATEIASEFLDDKVKMNYNSDVQYWYDNYFVASGYQKIKNKEKKGSDRKRMVFYLNKISFE